MYGTPLTFDTVREALEMLSRLPEVMEELDVGQDRSIHEFERLLLVDTVPPLRDVDDLVQD
jgi:hypothetical protein